MITVLKINNRKQNCKQLDISTSGYEVYIEDFSDQLSF